MTIMDSIILKLTLFLVFTLIFTACTTTPGGDTEKGIRVPPSSLRERV